MTSACDHICLRGDDCTTARPGASEMFRVVKPGGVVGMANWTPASFMRKLSDVSSKYLPPPPFAWGMEENSQIAL